MKLRCTPVRMAHSRRGGFFFLILRGACCACMGKHVWAAGGAGGRRAGGQGTGSKAGRDTHNVIRRAAKEEGITRSLSLSAILIMFQCGYIVGLRACAAQQQQASKQAGQIMPCNTRY